MRLGPDIQISRASEIASNNKKVLSSIENLSKNLRAIRAILELSCEDLAKYIGTTKQTISNIERKSKMSNCQYIAIRKILKRRIKYCKLYRR